MPMTNEHAAQYNLLMLSGDSSIARGDDGAFYEMLAQFSQYWQRIDVLTPTTRGAEARLIHKNVYVHPAPYHRVLQPAFIFHKGHALLSERAYHLMTSHDFGFFYNGLGAWWLLRRKLLPLVSEIHHIEGYPQANTVRERLWFAAAQRYIPFMSKHVAAFRVVNDEVAAFLRQCGVPDGKILRLSSVYLDLNRYQPQAVEKQYDVLFIGRLVANKGVLLLLDAIAQVKRTYPNISLAIRGDGPLKTVLRAKIAETNLSDNVIMLSRITDPSQMPTLYGRARMLVCASTVEGNPRVTIEAMACAVPVLSTPVGIMPNVIIDGVNGYLFEGDAARLADKICSLLGDSLLRQQIGEAGQQSVQQFDLKYTIPDYAQAYHHLIESTQA